MINEELCNLIWKQYNKYPSAHLYALWVAYKECSDFIGLCLFSISLFDNLSILMKFVIVSLVTCGAFYLVTGPFLWKYTKGPEGILRSRKVQTIE